MKSYNNWKVNIGPMGKMLGLHKRKKHANHDDRVSFEKVFVEIFHDAENCPIKDTTNGKCLHDTILEKSLNALNGKFDPRQLEFCAVNWRLILPGVIPSSASSPSSPSSPERSPQRRLSTVEQIRRTSATIIQSPTRDKKATDFHETELHLPADIEDTGLISSDLGEQSGAVDTVMKEMINDYLTESQSFDDSRKQNTLIIIISSSRNYTTNIQEMLSKNLKVLSIYEKNNPPPFLSLLPNNMCLGIWDELIMLAESTENVYMTRDANHRSQMKRRSHSNRAASAGKSRHSSPTREKPLYRSTENALKKKIMEAKNKRDQQRRSSTELTIPSPDTIKRALSDDTMSNDMSPKSNNGNNTRNTGNHATGGYNSPRNFERGEDHGPLDGTTYIFHKMHDDYYYNQIQPYLTECCKDLFRVLYFRDNKCMTSLDLASFHQKFPQHGKHMGKIEIYVNMKETGDLFMWGKCWFPQKTHSVNLEPSPYRSGEPLLYLRRPISVYLATKILHISSSNNSKISTSSSSSSSLAVNGYDSNGRVRSPDSNRSQYNNNNSTSSSSSNYSPTSGQSNSFFGFNFSPFTNKYSGNTRVSSSSSLLSSYWNIFLFILLCIVIFIIYIWYRISAQVSHHTAYSSSAYHTSTHTDSTTNNNNNNNNIYDSEYIISVQLKHVYQDICFKILHTSQYIAGKNSFTVAITKLLLILSHCDLRDTAATITTTGTTTGATASSIINTSNDMITV